MRHKPQLKIVDPQIARDMTARVGSTCGPERAAALIELHDSQYWRALGYKSFYVFCAQELPMGGANAYRIMKKARENGGDIATTTRRVHTAVKSKGSNRES